LKKLFKITILILLGLNAAVVFSQAYTWMPLGSSINNGTNDTTYAVTSFNGKLIYGGSFTNAGGVNANNIAAYDPVTNQWSALGSGINGEVKALIVYNNQLYAGGQFSSPGSNIAKWNGSNWQALGQGVNGEVLAFTIFNGDLAVGGDFDHAGDAKEDANNVAKWNGSSWGTYGNGLTGSGDRVSALTVFAGNLVAGGKFDVPSANNVAKWNGSSWQSFNNNDFEDRVQALRVFNGELYVGGRFESVGSVSNSKYIVKWNGSAWQSVGGGLDDGDVEALEVFRNNLIVAGNFRVTGTNLYVDRITVWTGSQWQRMLTGMDDRVKGLYTFNGTDTALYTSGEFTSAGGKWSYFAAKWGNTTTSTVSGTVRYAHNNLLVASGRVKIVRYDVITREVIVVDSVNFVNGRYTLAKVPKIDADLRVIIFPDDEMENTIDTSYVPTYYPSTLVWTEAGTVNPATNIDSVNVKVFPRVASLPTQQSVFTISGSVFLNILPPPTGVTAVPYWKNSIIYVKKNGNFVTYASTNEQQQYVIPGINAGTYDLTVVRLGYEYELRQVTISSQNLVENFYLDTLNPIGITNINSHTPKTYALRQNYPNPFNPATHIEFNMPVQGFVSLKVFNVLGKEVNTLVNQNLKTGVYLVDFDASALPSGVYFYRLQTELFTETKKMILLK
jgi:hypothetical protein